MARTNRHSIADILFREGDSSLICCCGEDIHDAYNDRLGDLFQDHRAAVGEPRRSFTDSAGIAESNEFMGRQKRGTVKSSNEDHPWYWGL